MKTILIITPHYPPSNLAAVHRSRLFAQHLPAFGWKPVILTVAERFYEESLDWNLHRLLPEGQQIEKVPAFPVTNPRLIGDIGLRAFFQLGKKALQLVKEEKVDFIYIPVPSFYTALLGPWLKRQTGVRYGIDYIDPWVHRFPGSEKKFSRHWWSTRLARWLEPLAVRGASLITGVAEGYYRGVLDRNPAIRQTCIAGAMPYGGEESDHKKTRTVGEKAILFTKKPETFQMVYAGAMLPRAWEPLEALMEAIKANPEIFEDVEFHFIGTGKRPNEATAYNIRPLAEKYGLWETRIFEYPARITYLDVLVHLEAAAGIFILGSTEPHYTPSKLYQAILSEKSVWAILHEQSEAFRVLEKTKGGIAFGLAEDRTGMSSQRLVNSFQQYREFAAAFRPQAVNRQELEQYSAFAVTKKLAALLDKIQP